MVIAANRFKNIIVEKKFTEKTLIQGEAMEDAQMEEQKNGWV